MRRIADAPKSHGDIAMSLLLSKSVGDILQNMDSSTRAMSKRKER